MTFSKMQEINNGVQSATTPLNYACRLASITRQRQYITYVHGYLFSHHDPLSVASDYNYNTGKWHKVPFAESAGFIVLPTIP